MIHAELLKRWLLFDELAKELSNPHLRAMCEGLARGYRFRFLDADTITVQISLDAIDWSTVGPTDFETSIWVDGGEG